MNDTLSPKNAQKWANALRSGNWEQSRIHLQNEYGYCCLGVACELFIPKDKQHRYTDREWKSRAGQLVGCIPTFANQPNAPKWLQNIDEDFSKLMNEGMPNDDYCLSSLNDNGYTFDEIADLIELVYVHKALD